MARIIQVDYVRSLPLLDLVGALLLLLLILLVLWSGRSKAVGAFARGLGRRIVFVLDGDHIDGVDLLELKWRGHDAVSLVDERFGGCSHDTITKLLRNLLWLPAFC